MECVTCACSLTTLLSAYETFDRINKYTAPQVGSWIPFPVHFED